MTKPHVSESKVIGKYIKVGKYISPVGANGQAQTAFRFSNVGLGVAC